MIDAKMHELEARLRGLVATMTKAGFDPSNVLEAADAIAKLCKQKIADDAYWQRKLVNWQLDEAALCEAKAAAEARAASLEAELEKARGDLIEATAELIYLRLYGKDGARWEANDSKDVWRDKARACLGG